MNNQVSKINFYLAHFVKKLNKIPDIKCTNNTDKTLMMSVKGRPSHKALVRFIKPTVIFFFFPP